MSSILVSEPASPGLVLVMERSDQIEDQGNTLTFYRGTSTRIGPKWKEPPFFVVSSETSLSQSFSNTVFHSIEALFVDRLSTIKGIERVFSRKDSDFFRVWIVIADIDLHLEDRIYGAQLAFMDHFPNIPFDFAVIFRQGKDPSSIQPSGARQLYPSV